MWLTADGSDRDWFGPRRGRSGNAPLGAVQPLASDGRAG